MHVSSCTIMAHKIYEMIIASELGNQNLVRHEGLLLVMEDDIG